MAKMQDALGTRGPNKQEASIGAVKAGPAKTVKGQAKGGGVDWAPQS